MEIRLLEYFVKLCEELNFTRAAEALGISQPTLSHQIHLLEARLNTQLFERTGRRVSLTQSGGILLEHARRVFYELDQALAEIRKLHGLQRGSLSVGCAGNHVLIQTAATFHEKYPGIELTIADMRSEEIIEALLNRELDLGVIFVLTKDPRLESIRLFDEEFCLVVSTDHELATAQSVSLQELSVVPLALLPKRFLIRQFIDEFTADHGIQLNPVLQLSSLESQREVLFAHKMATILTKSYVTQNTDPKFVAIPISDSPRKTVGLVYPKHTYLDQTRKTFIQHVLEAHRPDSILP